MVNAFSTGKGHLVEPPYGSYVDSWQLPVNSNFGLTDALVSGTTTINVTTILAGSPFVTLVFSNFDTTPTPWLNPLAGQNLRILLTGSLSFNITVYIPSGNPGLWIIDNQTTGNFTVTIKTNAAGSTGIAPSSGGSVIVFCDGTNVKLADGGNNADPFGFVPSGSIQAYAGTTVPTSWLTCNGAAISRTTYARLFSAIGTAWGAGDGSTTFNVPDLQNMFLRGSGTSPVGTYEADDLKSHTHSVNDPGHNHTYSKPAASTASGGPSGAETISATANTGNATTGISIGNTGGTETRPVNKRVLYIIKT